MERGGIYHGLHIYRNHYSLEVVTEPGIQWISSVQILHFEIDSRHVDVKPVDIPKYEKACMFNRHSLQTSTDAVFTFK